MNSKIHTGCHCFYCKRGRTKKIRRIFSKQRRLRHKQQLKNKGDIIDIDKSIGYTD